jgi:serine protease Do
MAVAAIWQPQAGGQPPAPPVDPEARAHAESLSTAFRQASHIAKPSVVRITTRSTRAPRNGGNPLEGTPFEDFFQSPLENGPGIPQMGLGSGVIISDDGTILTNNHVVEGADELMIELEDGRRFSTTKFVTDKRTDLALVYLEDASGLPVAQLGDSDSIDVGDWVIAIGSPFGLDHTVSAGIISSKGRSLGEVKRTTFLQTDAQINPGNSGGPLVNLNGEVIGINSAIASNTGTFQGIGFAVPINNAKWIIEQLKKNGVVQRAYLGVGITEVTPDQARENDLPRGVEVTEVREDTPGAAAGLQTSDVIVEFAGQPVRTPSELQRVVEQSPIDSNQTLKVFRDGKLMELQVTMKVMPEDFDEVAMGRGRIPFEGQGDLAGLIGLSLADLDSDEAKEVELAEADSGVAVIEVVPGSAAERMGFKPGNVIVRVGTKAVKNVDQFNEEFGRQFTSRNGVLFTVETPRGTKTWTLRR